VRHVGLLPDEAPAVRPKVIARASAVLGETQGELLVVGEQAAHVGQDDDAGPGRLGRPGFEGGEPVAVVGGQRERS
jgi:hypothetical protein